MANVETSSRSQFDRNQEPNANVAIVIEQPEVAEVDLEEVDARCKAAATAPWISYVVGRDLEAGLDCVTTGDAGSFELIGGTVADQDFIAHAREDIPRLVAETRHLRAILDAIRSRTGGLNRRKAS